MAMADQANIACGFHAGDPTTMLRTVRLAKKHNVAVGAHPGLPDKEGFGRRFLDIPPHDLHCQMLYQVGSLKAMLDAEGVKLNHIKPHGKLYRMIKDMPEVGEACFQAIKTFGVPFIGLPGTAHEELCKKHGIEFIPEFFPDLFYDEEGQTVPLVYVLDESSLSFPSCLSLYNPLRRIGAELITLDAHTALQEESRTKPWGRKWT